eukprot:CAMPEP_0168467552 /NCGR_PEP_ID=MMETSP0228-20121227/57241_1 /TAXON_ID=133427 /ORGANISM="Protoceratium reticulatum, Strain CCCM 535 (=CCMP 1889)" /LENGTH=90 /DNA_ID=CAMNT_0008483265 /DNA_START=270 /DNA_END=542 /DNA_ORIENTATION=+
MTCSTLVTSPAREKALQIVPKVMRFGFMPRSMTRRYHFSTPATSPAVAHPLMSKLYVTMSGSRPNNCMRPTCHFARTTSPACVQALTTQL